MQYLDNNMDELFRKASEHYPLKTDGANWEAIEKGMKEETSEISHVHQKQNKKYNKLLWLLLLIPLPFICINYNSNKNSKNNIAVSETQEVVENKDSNIDASIKATENERGRKDKNKAVSETNSEKADREEVDFLDGNKTSDERSAIVKENDTKEEVKRTNDKKFDNKEEVFSNTQDKKNNLKEQRDGLTDLGTSASEDAVYEKKDTALANATASTPGADTTLTIKKDSLSVKNNKSLKKNIPKQKGFYAGIIGGPDVSTIKYQAIKHPGYSVGVLVGYRFNRNISLESGFLLDRKKYYTDGKYFDKKRTTIPDYVWIKDMDGSCDMFEVPINFRYDITSAKTNRFFATAGFSSYIMKKEDYNYNANANGNWYYGSRSYKNSTNNWFGVVNLSAGYEVNLSNITNIRIEPYFKVPLKGLGIGNMPITSAGVYFGVTRYIK